MKRLLSKITPLLSLILLVGLLFPWMASHDHRFALTLFRWRYHGDLPRSTSWQATFAISGGEIGVQAVRFFGSYPVHRRYYRMFGEAFHDWIPATSDPLPLTRSRDWPAHYGYRHDGDPSPDFMQSWRLVLPFWGVAIVLMIAPITVLYRRLRSKSASAAPIDPTDNRA